MTIDAHNHIYLPRYIQMLRERDQVPRIACDGNIERLIILAEEDIDGKGGGRPVDSSYWNIEEKLNYMDTYEIDAAVVSLANPWLDFLDAEDAIYWAQQLNEDLQKICEDYPNRLYGLGVLPFQDISACLTELNNIANFTWMRGAIISTRGAGNGLDDPSLDPVWKQAEDFDLPLFVHPHYGIGTEHFGKFSYSLNFALGFPFETTVAGIRLVLSGALDRFPNLKLLLAHGGGSLPYLSGRLDSCVQKYTDAASRLQCSTSEYLRRFYYDALTYHAPAISCAVAFVGSNHLLFGTDNSFTKNPLSIYSSLDHLKVADKTAILEGNARTLFHL
jgi:predicted TIM-barrel fold metal-dependent hydrolase